MSGIVGVQGECLPLGQEACSALAEVTERPMVFALSEPGVLTPDDAFTWTDGRAIFTDARWVCFLLNCCHLLLHLKASYKVWLVTSTTGEWFAESDVVSAQVLPYGGDSPS